MNVRTYAVTENGLMLSMDVCSYQEVWGICSTSVWLCVVRMYGCMQLLSMDLCIY